jgi:hypothetical protein
MQYNDDPMAKTSKLDKCVRCKKHHAIVGAFTSYYGVGLKGKTQIKGSFPAQGYCLKCLLKRARKEGLSSAQRDELRKKLERNNRHHNSKSQT